MQQITANEARIILQEGKQRCALKVNNSFYYSESGRSYRFEQHHNEKALEAQDLYAEGLLTKQALQQMVKQLVLKQMQYDWFTDVTYDSLSDQLLFLRQVEIFFF